MLFVLTLDSSWDFLFYLMDAVQNFKDITVYFRIEAFNLFTRLGKFHDLSIQHSSAHVSKRNIVLLLAAYDWVKVFDRGWRLSRIVLHLKERLELVHFSNETDFTEESTIAQ